jgi:hypothetical protein
MKRPKLFYIPGMLSLLVVPVLFYIYQPVIKTPTVLRLFIPTDDKSPNLYRFSRYSVKAQLKGKKINTVYLDGNRKLNSKKLDFIADEALKLKFYNDTTQIIKVRFTDETTYGEFVQLVNIMYRDDHKRYALLDNDFYNLGDPPLDPPDPHGIKICGFGADVIMTERVKTWQEKLSEQISYYWSPKNALLLAAFVLLIAVPVVIKRKMSK